MKTFNTLLVVTSLSLSGLTLAQGSVHWSYSGEEGPAHWAELDESFITCGTGKNQSPIDIQAAVEGTLPAMTLNYKPNGNQVINNGHTVQVNYKPGSTLSIDGAEFELKQFHFHSPSENTIEGVAFPMEAHFVHADRTGNLAVIGVMFNTGEHNSELEKAWAHMPTHAGQKNALIAHVDASKLIPSDLDYFRFNGSLTTPPCSEGVNWFVMKTSVSASKEQLNQFIHTMHHDNNRPVQPINARKVIK